MLNAQGREYSAQNSSWPFSCIKRHIFTNIIVLLTNKVKRLLFYTGILHEKKYNIDTKGITFKIQRSENLLKLEYYGITDPDNIGRIDLLPNAFTNEEQLIRTVIHEKCHVKQLNKYGKKYVQDNLADMEKQAYKFEDVFYNILKRRANL